VLECEQLYADAQSWRNTTLDVGIPYFLFWMSLHSFFSVLQYKMWLSSQMAGFFDIGIQKLIPKYDKCLNSGSE
jgi:hypothetical protein